MLGILITLLVIAGVAYCVLKNYYPPIILLLAGFVMLICAALNGTTFVSTKVLMLNGLSPAQIFTLRFSIAYIMMQMRQLWEK